jgi:hypothetical protein
MVSQIGYLVAFLLIAIGIVRSPWWKMRFNKKIAGEQPVKQV